MNLLLNLIPIFIIILKTVLSEDACEKCRCSENNIIINCDSKGWTSLANIEFPSNVVTLTFVNNKLKFDTVDDRIKIENLRQLSILSLNRNPLGTIPLFNNSNIRSISLQDTSLISAEFPSIYFGSLLQTISLSNNKIRTIKVDDFYYLKNSKIKKLHIDSGSLSIIDQNAFNNLIELQSLSLKNNFLKSCEFLPTFRLLSSINFDGNQFNSLPQQLSILNNIKTYSFKNNSISIIDQSSPLHIWMKMNYTNIKIYLANNPFDCCQSLWFIRFLNISRQFISDASLLTCAQPKQYSGQFLIKLNPDEMNCGEIPPSKSWWTIDRIIGISIGGSILMVALIIGIIFFTYQKRSRSGYTEIGGMDDPAPPTAPPLPSINLPFPTYDENNDDDDGISAYSTAVTRQTSGSQAPTHTTHTDKTFKKTRKNALKERKYAVLTVDIRKNGVFTNY